MAKVSELLEAIENLDLETVKKFKSHLPSLIVNDYYVRFDFYFKNQQITNSKNYMQPVGSQKCNSGS